jgi:hypothetical protein
MRFAGAASRLVNAPLRPFQKTFTRSFSLTLEELTLKGDGEVKTREQVLEEAKKNPAPRFMDATEILGVGGSVHVSDCFVARSYEC